MYDWDSESTRILKAELARKGVGYKALVSKLAALGVTETEGAIANKINRGTFRMAFFVQCMKAINTETVFISAEEKPESPEDKERREKREKREKRESAEKAEKSKQAALKN